LGQPANPAALREHRLKHREHRLRGLGCSGVANEVSQLVAARVNGTHVTAQIVHEDFGRVRATLHHLVIVLVVPLVLTVIHRVQEALHDADVLDIRIFVHRTVFHE
jgi:hypothetical protein